MLFKTKIACPRSRKIEIIRSNKYILPLSLTISKVIQPKSVDFPAMLKILLNITIPTCSCEHEACNYAII